jgi:hypothetical protein
MTQSRWICKSIDGYAIDDVREALKKVIEDKFRTYIGTEDDELTFSVKGTEDDELRYTVDLHEDIQRKDLKYLHATLYFDYEQPAANWEITDSGAVNETHVIEKKTDGVDFWVSNTNLFLFPKSKKSSPETGLAIELLSKIIFNKPGQIKPVKFDIEKIEDDILAHNQSNLWTFGFRRRRGKITSATLWGDDISLDELYHDAGNARRKSIGIKVKIGERQIKTRVTKDGTVMAYTGFTDFLDVSQLFDIVDIFSPFQKVKR